MKFEVKGEIRITDPCYVPGDGGRYIELVNAKLGTWLGDANIDDVVEYITVWHESYNPDDGSWVHAGRISVDTGQIVIGNVTDLHPEDEDWYEDISSLYECAEIIGGLYCSSGYGDGVYDVYKQEKEGKIVALEVVFV